MTPKQVFLSLTASFMAALSADLGISRTKARRALELAMEFEWGSNLNAEESAFEYANWVINGGSPPNWVPAKFRSL